MSTAAEALAEFGAGARDGTGPYRIVGYCYAPGAAFWFALNDAGIACGPDGPLDLSTVFELYATDGHRELRWLQTAAGSGATAVLADRPQPVPVPPQRRRLAGDVTGVRSGTAGPWATLFTARYGPADVPVEAAPGDRIEIESAEYVTEDDHGNLTVTGARWISLRAVGGSHDQTRG